MAYKNVNEKAHTFLWRSKNGYRQVSLQIIIYNLMDCRLQKISLQFSNRLQHASRIRALMQETRGPPAVLLVGSSKPHAVEHTSLLAK